MVKTTKIFFDLLAINSRIQYNKPFYTQCPICMRPKALIVTYNRTGAWGICKACKICGPPVDWISFIFAGKPINNFYTKAQQMLTEYSDRIKNGVKPSQEKLLMRLGYTSFNFNTRYPFIGITRGILFYNDLARAARNSSIKRWEKKGLYRVKKWDDVIVIPIYSAYGRIAGFTVYNGYATKSYYHGNKDDLYYRQGKGLEVDKVFVAESLPQMMKFQSENALVPHRIPANMILPYNTSPHRNFRPFKVVQPREMNFLTYDDDWAIQMGGNCKGRARIKFLSAPSDKCVTPNMLADYPHHFNEYITHMRALKLYGELPPIKLKIERDAKFNIDEKGITRTKNRKTKYLTYLPISVAPTELPHMFEVSLANGVYTMKERIHEKEFETIEIFNMFLASKYLKDRKPPRLLAGWKKDSILNMFLALQPITRSYFDEQKQKRKEQKAEKQSA